LVIRAFNLADYPAEGALGEKRGRKAKGGSSVRLNAAVAKVCAAAKRSPLLITFLFFETND